MTTLLLTFANLDSEPQSGRSAAHEPAAVHGLQTQMRRILTMTDCAWMVATIFS